MRALLSAALLWAAPASATEGLQWQWPEGETRTWQLEAHVLMPIPITLLSERVHQARVGEFWVQLVTTCAVEDERKIGWDLDCSIDDFRLRAYGRSSENDKLAAIAAEFDERVSRSTLQFRLTRDGRVRNIDITGFPKETPRLKDAYLNARLMVSRAVSALDMQLPKDGVDNDEMWSQGDPFAMRLVPAYTGSMGGSVCGHRVVATKGDDAKIETVAEGIIGTEARFMFDTKLNAESTFDTRRGVLLERGYSMSGKSTASSRAGTSVIRYMHGAVAQLIEEGTTREPFGPSGLLSEEEAWIFGVE